MDNEQVLEKVTDAEYEKWKLSYRHGDAERMAKKFGGSAARFRRALKTQHATPEVKKAINIFYKKKKAA